MAASLTATTLSAALAKTSQGFKVASATYCTKGSILFCDGEAMLVCADPLGAFLPIVQRGYAGTFATAHASGAVVWANPPAAYSENEPMGAAAAANEGYLPRIVLAASSIFTLVNGLWTKLVDKGIPVAIPGGATQSYTEAGAINLVGGTHRLKVGAGAAFTLAAPDGNTPEGTIMTFAVEDAYAYTITQAGNIGFLNTTTSSDVATGAATAGGGMTIQVIGGAWRLIANSGVANVSSFTFG